MLMNFLAHFYLSGNDKSLIKGNFIADAVKGKKYQKYPEGIRKGILFHREIDSYTDRHEHVKKSSSRLQNKHGKYAPVIVDVLYDHFLAGNWERFSDIPLREYSGRIYKILWEDIHRYPFQSQLTLTYMTKRDWLTNYAELKGVKRALKGLSRRASFKNNMSHAGELIEENYEALEEDFLTFFPEIIQFSKNFLRERE